MARRARPRALFTIALVALAPVLVCPTAWAQPNAHRTALVVHWGTEDYPSNPKEDAAIREALVSGSETPIDYHAEYLESEVFPGEEASLALRDYIQRKYRGRRIDVSLRKPRESERWRICEYVM